MLENSGKVKFKLKKKSKVRKYDKSDYYGVDLYRGYKKYRYLSNKNNPEPRLLNYELSGEILLYSKDLKWSNIVAPLQIGGEQTFMNSTMIISKIYFIKINNKIIRIGERLKNKHLKYFEDCEILMTKIESSEFKRNEIK